MIRRLTTIVAAGALVAGCSPSPRTGAELTHSQALWDARTAYVGDNSRVAALVSLTGPFPQGSYTLSLETTSTPYGLTINVTTPDKPCSDVSSEQAQRLLLGLVANLDRVTVRCEGETHTETVVEATRALGFDVKVLGRDRDRLAAYVEGAAD